MNCHEIPATFLLQITTPPEKAGWTSSPAERRMLPAKVLPEVSSMWCLACDCGAQMEGFCILRGICRFQPLRKWNTLTCAIMHLHSPPAMVDWWPAQCNIRENTKQERHNHGSAVFIVSFGQSFWFHLVRWYGWSIYIMCGLSILSL